MLSQANPHTDYESQNHVREKHKSTQFEGHALVFDTFSEQSIAYFSKEYQYFDSIETSLLFNAYTIVRFVKEIREGGDSKLLKLTASWYGFIIQLVQ